MDRQGLWELFFATGAPEVWLTIRCLKGEREEPASAAPPEQN